MVDCQVKGCKGKMIYIVKAGLVRCECDRCGTILYQTDIRSSGIDTDGDK